MAKEQSGYDVVIADLEAERDQLNNMIAALKRRKAGGAASLAGISTVVSAGPINAASIPGDAFFGMTLPDAGHKYLSMVKAPTPHAKFCDALLEGGFKTTASNFREVVRSTLSRHPDFVKVSRGEWGLKEWYGNRASRRSKRTEALQGQESTGEGEGAKA